MHVFIVQALRHHHSSSIHCNIYATPVIIPGQRMYVSHAHTHLQTQTSTSNMHAYTQSSALGPSHVYSFDNSLTQDLSVYGNNTLTATGSPQQTEGKVRPSVTQSACLFVRPCFLTYVCMYVCTCVYTYVCMYVHLSVSQSFSIRLIFSLVYIQTYVMLTCRSTRV
jgi:hypothetical protein